MSPQNENVRFEQNRNVRFHGLSARDKTGKPDSENVEKVSPDKPNVTLAGTVEKIIPTTNGDPESADFRCKVRTTFTARLESKTLCRTGTAGSKFHKKDAEVDVRIEADPKDVKPKE